jgi:cytochrome c-type biogenesis protein CcmI
MLIFWLIISVMIFIAIAFITLPLLRKKPQKDISQREVTRLVYRDRLKELQEQYQHGFLTEPQLLVEKESLTQNLLQDLSDETTISIDIAKAKAKKKDSITAIFFALIIPMLAIPLYLQWGDSTGVAEQLAMQKNSQEIHKEIALYHNPQQLIKRMQAILLQRPNSARGWYLLGRLYVGQREFSQAVIAFKRANQLQPQQPQIMLQYAESLFFANGERLPPLAVQLLKQVLIKMPNSLDTINLLAMDAYNQHNYPVAIHYWESLLNFLAPTSDDGKAILRAIAEAQNAYAKQKIRISQ